MQVVTINLSLISVDILKCLIEKGLYPSRSEAIRVAIRDFLIKELEFVESFLNLENKEPTNLDDGNIVFQSSIAPKKVDMRKIKSGWNQARNS